MVHDPEAILARAVQIGEELDRTYEKDVVFQTAAIGYQHAGRSAEARRLVNRISHESVRAMSSYSLATALVKAGRLGEAVEIAAGIQESHFQDIFRVELLAAQVKAGDELAAWRTFAQIGDSWFKSLA